MLYNILLSFVFTLMPLITSSKSFAGITSSRLKNTGTPELDETISNCIENQGEIDLSQILSKLPVTQILAPTTGQENLKHLNLSQSTNLINTLRHLSKDLETLVLSQCKLREEEYSQIFKHFNHLENLDILAISENNIGDSSLPDLLPLKKLKVFCLDSNRIGPAGAKFLAMFENLQYLSLNSNSIGDNGMVSLIATMADINLKKRTIYRIP